MPHGAWPGTATIAQLSLIGTCEGQSIVNVHHFAAPAANEAAFTGDADRQTWAAGLITDWRTNCRAAYLSGMVTDYSLIEHRAQVLEVPGQVSHRLAAVSDVTGLPAAGTSGHVAGAMESAADVKWRTTIASRHTRGRNYFGPLSDEAVNQGRVVGADAQIVGIQSYVTAMARYIGAGAGVVAGFYLVVYSRPYSAPKGAYTKRVGGALTVVNNTTDYNGAFTAITSGVLDTITRSQRRREIGVGS